MQTIGSKILFAALLSSVMLLVVAPATRDLANGQITESLEVQIETSVLPYSSDLNRTHFIYEEGQTILNNTLRLTVVTNDRDWRLPIWLGADTKMPEAMKITCRLLGDGMAVIREGAITNGYVQLLGTGEVGSFDLFLNVEGIWEGQVPDSLQRVVLDYTGKQSPRKAETRPIKKEEEIFR